MGGGIENTTGQNIQSDFIVGGKLAAEGEYWVVQGEAELADFTWSAKDEFSVKGFFDGFEGDTIFSGNNPLTDGEFLPILDSLSGKRTSSRSWLPPSQSVVPELGPASSKYKAPLNFYSSEDIEISSALQYKNGRVKFETGASVGGVAQGSVTGQLSLKGLFSR